MKKKINIGLILLVVIVWGVLGYRLVKNYFYKPGDEKDYAFNYEKDIDIITERDSFILEPLKRDPFLNKAVTNKEITRVASQKSAGNAPKRYTNVPKPMQVLSWPSIQYYGYIKRNNDPEVYLLKVNNHSLRFRKGETKDDITLTKVFNDSIILSFEKKERTFYITKK